MQQLLLSVLFVNDVVTFAACNIQIQYLCFCVTDSIHFQILSYSLIWQCGTKFVQQLRKVIDFYQYKKYKKQQTFSMETEQQNETKNLRYFIYKHSLSRFLQCFCKKKKMQIQDFLKYFFLFLWHLYIKEFIVIVVVVVVA